MSAPVKKCEVTPLEALRRLYDVARKVDASESGEFETLLQGELAVAELVLRDAAAPVVPVAAQSVVPEGWKLVPIEPTEAMLLEVDEDVGGHCYSCSVWKASWDDCRRVYAAMLAAAPSLEAQPAGEGEKYQPLLTRITEAFENYERMGQVCEFEGQPMIYASTLLEIAAMAQGEKQ